jgi:hypothetical protein
MTEPKPTSIERILKDIAGWTKMYQNRVSEDGEIYQDVYRLLQDFEDFSEEYLRYFEQEVIAQGIYEGTTPDNVRYKVLQRIVAEWTDISRVVEQRELSRYENWLTKADSHAREYLPKDVPGVVSYLGKANLIRHNIYSAISVVSIPRDQYDGEDWMAAPHELGHQVFWNLTTLEKLPEKHRELGETVQDIGKKTAATNGLSSEQGQSLAMLLDSWLEELFADVYGTFVAGEDFPKSIINILKQQIGQADELRSNDGEHPIPLLRPLARIKVLELNGEDASASRSAWETFLNDIGAVNTETWVMELFSEPGQAEESTTSEPVKLPLPVVEEALYSAVEKLLSIAKNVSSEGIGYPAQDSSTFQRLKTYIEKQAHEQGKKAYELLLRPLSTVSGETHTGKHGHTLSGYHSDHKTASHGRHWHTHTEHGVIF